MEERYETSIRVDDHIITFIFKSVDEVERVLKLHQKSRFYRVRQSVVNIDSKVDLFNKIIYRIEGLGIETSGGVLSFSNPPISENDLKLIPIHFKLKVISQVEEEWFISEEEQKQLVDDVISHNDRSELMDMEGPSFPDCSTNCPLRDDLDEDKRANDCEMCYKQYFEPYLYSPLFYLALDFIEKKELGLAEPELYTEKEKQAIAFVKRELDKTHYFKMKSDMARNRQDSGSGDAKGVPEEYARAGKSGPKAKIIRRGKR